MTRKHIKTIDRTADGRTAHDLAMTLASRMMMLDADMSCTDFDTDYDWCVFSYDTTSREPGFVSVTIFDDGAVQYCHEAKYYSTEESVSDAILGTIRTTPYAAYTAPASKAATAYDLAMLLAVRVVMQTCDCTISIIQGGTTSGSFMLEIPGHDPALVRINSRMDGVTLYQSSVVGGKYWAESDMATALLDAIHYRNFTRTQEVVTA